MTFTREELNFELRFWALHNFWLTLICKVSQICSIMFMSGEFGGQQKLRRVFLKPLCSNSGCVGCCIAQVCWNLQWTWMDADDQPGCIRMYHLSECYLDASGVPYHSYCTCPTLIKSLHQLEQSLADTQGPWIHEVVCIPVQVHPLDTIGNETRQTRQHVSSHQ